MARKISHKKTKHSKKRTPSFGFNFHRLAIAGFVLVVAGFSVFSIFRSHQLASTDDPQRNCANSISCIDDLSGDDEDVNAKFGIFNGKEISVPQNNPENKIAVAESNSQVLGDTTSSNKHIAIDLSSQTLSAMEGDTVVKQFSISSGKWKATPTGHFTIWIKLYVTRMVGGSKALGTYYNLPNIHYTEYMYNDQYPKSYGLGIHEAYWHNNFGHPMSHGCINMRLDDAKWVYDWVNPPTVGGVTKATDSNPGTPVDIYGVTPAS